MISCIPDVEQVLFSLIMASNLQENVMLGSFKPIDFEETAKSQENMGGENSMLVGSAENGYHTPGSHKKQKLTTDEDFELVKSIEQMT